MAIRTRRSTPTVKAAEPTKRSVARPKPLARTTDKPEVRLFISYCHADRDARKRLVDHLAPLLVDGASAWWDEAIEAGAPVEANIRRELKRAHIFVALLSRSYFASRYCWEIEYAYAERRRARGPMRLVCFVAKPCLWTRTSAARFKLLPRNGVPPERWSSNDAAYADGAEGIGEVIRSVRRERATATPKPPRVKPKVEPGPPKPALPKPASPKAASPKAASNVSASNVSAKARARSATIPAGHPVASMASAKPSTRARKPKRP